MIEGYEVLSNKILQTKEMIDLVSVSSQEQSRGISQINDAISIIDKNTQETAAEASGIDSLTSEVKILSERLLSVSKHVTYREETKHQVCDIEMTYRINRLQLGHVKFKDSNFGRLNERTKFRVTNETECALGQWIVQMEKENQSFTKGTNWSFMKEHHRKVHAGVEDFISNNVDHRDSLVLIPKAVSLEESIDNVFGTLNKIKIENCKNKG